MGILRRKKREQIDGSDWQSGTDFGHSPAGSSTGLVPGGSFPGPGIYPGGLSGRSAQFAYSGASPGVNTGWITGSPMNVGEMNRLIQQYQGQAWTMSPSILPPGAVSVAMPPLETEEREDPVRAWKRVSLQKSETWEMVSRMSGETFGGGISEATCRAYYPSNHALQSPDDSCTCGFYGYKQIEFEDFAPRFGSIPQPWLEVDFYGKVIECEKGYRAQYQQPLRLHVEESFFEFVGGRHITNAPRNVELIYVHSGSLLKPYDLISLPPPEPSQCLNPQTLAREIGIPVVVGAVEYK